MRVPVTDEYVKMIGRTKLYGETCLLSLSGSGIEFIYSGKGLSLTILGGAAALLPDNKGNYARIAVYVDGERTIDTQISAKETIFRLAESEVSATHLIRIIKLSECAMSLTGIQPIEIGEGETVTPSPLRSRKIEFIGDSITCGYGIDDEDPLHPFQTATEDVTRAYAYQTAAALDADYSMFSTSGYGIISGYTSDPSMKMDHQLIPTFYESFGFSYDTMPGIPAPMDIPWDFSGFTPDAIVINLGTNDDSYCQEMKERQEEYAAAYVEFLKRIRRHNPGAMLFCVLGLMGDRLYPWVCKAAEDYRLQTGDTRITTLRLPEQDASVGYVSDYHPLESAHTKAARLLIQKLRDTMQWS